MERKTYDDRVGRKSLEGIGWKGRMKKWEYSSRNRSEGGSVNEKLERKCLKEEARRNRSGGESGKERRERKCGKEQMKRKQ